MKVKYVGPYDEVDIAAAGLSCKQGETVEVDDELGESLLEQEDNWEPVDKAAKDAAKTLKQQEAAEFNDQMEEIEAAEADAGELAGDKE